MSAPHPIVFVVPGDPNQRTGGYLYDAHMVNALKQAGHAVRVVGLDGQFPIPDAVAKESLSAVLSAHPTDALIIIDGLALGGLGEVVTAIRNNQEIYPAASRARWVGLVHHPLADETGLDADTTQWLWGQEKLALSTCDQVIVTSAFTASRLMERGYIDTPPIIVTPGVDKAPLAKHAKLEFSATKPAAARLLTVASLTPRKGHAVLLEALAEIKALDWVSEWVGDPRRDGDHANGLMQQIEALGLTDRVVLWGEQDAQALHERYGSAHVCVLPSFYEGYGMVITEAIARGLPVITTDGGALPTTVPEGAGIIVPAGDAKALASALRSWCEDATLRASLIQGAIEARESLTDWSKAGERFIEAALFGC